MAGLKVFQHRGVPSELPRSFFSLCLFFSRSSLLLSLSQHLDLSVENLFVIQTAALIHGAFNT